MEVNLKKIAKLCKIETRITYHQSRHNFGTLITLSQGVPMETVSQMMGHKCIKTTQIYAKLTRQKLNEDMKKLSSRIGGKYKLEDYVENENEANQIRLAAPLHDLGKIAVPDAILQKTGRFTAEEYEVMKTHTVKGHHLLKKSSRKLLRLAADMAMGHHEHWDGSGYPSGLSGEKIPLSSRICAVADVLDALISARCYKEAWSEDTVKEFFIKQSNSQFQKELVDILLSHWDEFIEIYR